MNWRDPETDLVHTVNYRTNTLEWGMGAKVQQRQKMMLCGVAVRVTTDGLVDIPGAVVLRPFLHTQDEPTCLGCLVWAPKQVENEADG